MRPFQIGMLLADPAGNAVAVHACECSPKPGAILSRRTNEQWLRVRSYDLQRAAVICVMVGVTGFIGWLVTDSVVPRWLHGVSKLPVSSFYQSRGGFPRKPASGDSQCR
jgi:hypothetical protein